MHVYSHWKDNCQSSKIEYVEKKGAFGKTQTFVRIVYLHGEEGIYRKRFFEKMVSQDSDTVIRHGSHTCSVGLHSKY